VSEYVESARNLVASSFVLDAHFDWAMELADRATRGETRVSREHHLPSLRSGGVDCFVSSLFVHSLFLPEMGLRMALDEIACALEEFEAFPEDLALCRTMAEAEAARAGDRVGVLLSFEGVEPLGNDLKLLRVFYALGVRGVGIAWSRRNYAGDGCWFAPKREGRKGGLTDFGMALVEEAQRLGMWIDLSHLNDEGFRDAMEVLRTPPIASHSNARALVPGMMRNLTDEQIRAIADRGGVIGMNACSAFVAPDQASRRLGPEDLAAHADHIARLTGIEHVGIGFDLCDGFPDCFGQPSSIETYDTVRTHAETPLFAEALLRRGYTEEQVSLVLGGNFRRVFREILDRERPLPPR
jgi:membrane dipeptidase